MYCVCVFFDVKPECRDEFERVARKQAATSLASEEGCLRFEIFRHPENPNNYYFHEVYASRSAVDDVHDKSEYLAEFRAASAPLINSRERTEWIGVD